ncbi:MAG: Transglutaminase [Modestobacter sp.]|nr:Transglutaminase [Modestobacter sp.]
MTELVAPPPTGPRTGTAVAAAIAVLLGALALDPVFAARTWLAPVGLAVAVVGLGGAGLRAGLARLLAADGTSWPAGVLGALVPVGQAVGVLCLLTTVFAPDDAFAGILPTPTSVGALGSVLASGMAEIREQATPALPLTGLVALTTLFVALIALAVDLVAVAGRQPALGGLGLLVLYCVPVSTITGDIALFSFLAPAVGFGLLLWADQRSRLARGDRAGSGSPLGTGTLTAVRTGALALVAGVLLPVVVPTLAEGSLATRLGGNGGTSSTGTALDPVAEMRGQLTLPKARDLLQVSSSVDDPGYLRSVALDVYDGTGWRMGNLDGEASISQDGPLVTLPTRETAREVTATVTATGHDDRFLPTLSAPRFIDVRGGGNDDWRIDPATDTVFGRTVSTAGRTWSVVAEEPEPTVEQLRAAPDLALGDRMRRYTTLPQLNPSVTDLVGRLTAGARSPYERVLAVYDHLTDRANGFTYSLSTSPGTSGDDLANFLRLKRGYCEQYAGTMAVLVRAAGVPARVVLGYTPGDSGGGHTRTITTDDAHAWVEVWFSGLGWVTFDPTPLGAGRAVTLPWAPRADATVDPATVPPAPDAAPVLPTGPQAQINRDDRYTPLRVPVTASGSPLVGWLSGGGVAALALVLAAVPWAVRRRQRSHRVSDGRPAALWDELLATTTDLGIAVPPTATARVSARQLAERVAGVAPAAVPAVRELALAEERSVYGPPGAGATPQLRDALAEVRRGLLRTVSRRRRLGAALWPASTVGAAAQWLSSHIPRRPRPV